MLLPLHFPGRNKALLTESYKIGAAGAQECLLDQLIICRIAVLDQSPLHGFFVRIPGNIDLVHLCGTCRSLTGDFSCLFPREGVQPRIVHTGGNSSGCRIKILHLFRHIAQLAYIFSQSDGIPERAAGMRRHEVRNNILVLACLFVHLLKGPDKFTVYIIPRLAHFRQHMIGDMFRGNPQLTADVVLAEFPQKSPVAVRKQVIKAEAGADKNLFYAGQGAELFEQGQVISVVDLQIGAGLREKTASVPAGTVGHLLFTGRCAELRGRTSDIINIALEIWLLQHLPCLLQDGLVAAHLYDAALVEG